MTDSAALLELLQDDIEGIENVMRADVSALAKEMDPLLAEIIRYGLFGGGKRVRPLLVVVSARLCGSADQSLYRLASAFEYLHVATLFHDDVIDQADSRRGRASVVKAYGIAPAILGGDFLHARSMEIIGQYGGVRALDIFCNATRSIVDGEFVQLRNVGNSRQAQRDYFAAIEGKTAVLISAATEIGAVYGGGGRTEQLALREYGRNLGYAFQIIDDLLDYQGESCETGKFTGNDLVEGKMTLPLILALERCQTEDGGEIQSLFADERRRRKSFDRVASFITEHDGFVSARQMAETHIEKALGELAIFPQQKKREKEILQGLARYVLTRRK